MIFNRTIRFVKFTVLALVAVAVLAPETALANQFKRIRDVNVSCNNALSCDIYITNPRVTLQTFGFRRRASEASSTAMYLSMREPLRAGSSLQIQIDGSIISEIDVSALSYRAATYEYIFRDEAAVTALLQAARSGALLQISYTTKAGRSTAPFSLSGMTAGMIFADEVQGRVGRDDALMAITGQGRVENGDGTSAAATPFRVWGDVPAPMQAYFGTDNHLCSNAFGAADAEIFGAGSTDLGSGQTLILLPCGDPGAYNFPSAFWLGNGDIYTPLALPIIGANGPTVVNQVWNAVWDEPSGTLSSFFKGRGLGDCGSVYQWRLSDGDFGASFSLESQRVKDRCDGIYEDDFSDYEMVWPQP